MPCHRVIAADGSLTGYLGGLQRKQALLEFEAAGGLPCVLLARWNQRSSRCYDPHLDPDRPRRRPV
ncbi:MAG: MGMT family protein [Actinomycetota bacterium]|nr:MGMT family protein [Actinomycetota bacterium]